MLNRTSGSWEHQASTEDLFRWHIKYSTPVYIHMQVWSLKELIYHCQNWYQGEHFQAPHYPKAIHKGKFSELSISKATELHCQVWRLFWRGFFLICLPFQQALTFEQRNHILFKTVTHVPLACSTGRWFCYVLLNRRSRRNIKCRFSLFLSWVSCPHFQS